MFTEYAKKLMSEIKNEYPNLWKFYNEYMGSFQMTKFDVGENLNDILKWLEVHNDYVLLSEDNEDYENAIYFLTDILE